MRSTGQTPTNMNVEDGRLPGPGGLLRAARESSSMSLRDISAQLHLDQHTLDALERDDFINLPAPTYVRGYLRGYARLLSVPVGPVMEAYDREGFRPPDLVADIAESPEGSNASDFPVRIVTWAVGLVLIGLVIVWWNNQGFGELERPTPISESALSTADTEKRDAVPMTATNTAQNDDPKSSLDATAQPGTSEINPTEGDNSRQAVDMSQTQTAALSAATELALPLAQPNSESTSDTDTAHTEEVLAQAREALEQSRQLNDTATQPISDATTPSTPSADLQIANDPGSNSNSEPEQQATPGEGHLEISFADEAWVEIYDRKDNRLFYDLAKPGQELNLRGTTPIRVLLGRARDVTLRFNGDEFDIRPFTEKGIARFTLGTTIP